MSERSHISIGPFELAGAPRSLWFGASSVELDARSLELLVAIARHPDGVAAAQLWPLVSSDSPFDEDRLCEFVGAINQALVRWSPDCYVAWFPEAAVPRFAIVDATRRAGAAGGLPARRADVFGRDDAIERVVGQLRAHRFVTILAAGGMGKTTVAMAAMHVAAGDHPDGVHVVDIAPIVDGNLLARRVAAVVGCLTAGADALAGLQQWAARTRALVVLDSCEHVIDAAARVAEALGGAGSLVAVLATSREPLRARGEWLYRLAPMRLPQPGEAVSAAQAMDFSALRLFVERARAVAPGFSLRDVDVPLLVSLCTRLDGIALGIEIVAARVDTLALSTLAAQLEVLLLHLPVRQHGAPPRHATLAALLDWSFNLLSHVEQQVLRRLSVFRNGFITASALEVVADEAIPAADVQETLLDLIAKSLVAPERGADPDRWRLLDTTRAYAGVKLDESGERDATQRRHAAWIAAELAEAERRWNRMERPQWVAQHAPLIDDVRGALDWTFTPGGDVGLGVVLTGASLSLGIQMLLIEEFIVRIKQAVEALVAHSEARPDGQGDVATKMEQARLNLLISNFISVDFPRTGTLATTLDSAVAMLSDADDFMQRYMAFKGMWSRCIGRGDFLDGANWVGRLADLAETTGDPIVRLVAGRVQAQNLQFLGRHAQACEQAHRVLGEAWRTIPLAYNPSPVELRVSMRVVLARAFWMQGFPDRATEMAGEAMAHAATDSPLAQCQAITMAAVVLALWSGHGRTAQSLAARLAELEPLVGADHWLRWARRLREAVALQFGGDIVVSPDHGFFDESEPVLADHLATLDDRWLSPICVQRVATGMVGWCAPEALRRQGERALREQSVAGFARGEDFMRRSLALAREQGALSWELRTATSLARHWLEHDRAAEARGLLEPVLGRFTEGFETADWLAASRVLAAA